MNKELDCKVKELRELMRKKEEVEAEIAKTQDVFKIVMSALETDELKGDDWKVTWKTSIRNTIDSKKLREDHPEIAAEYNKQSEQRRFLLS